MNRSGAHEWLARHYWVVLLLTLPAGVFCGFTIGHPGDPPNIYTFFAALSLLLLLIGAIQNVADKPAQAWQCVGSVALVGYCAVVVGNEPFLDVDIRNLTGLVAPLVWLIPVFVAGGYFIRRQCWLPAIASGIFIWNAVALWAFSVIARDPAAFVHIIR